MQMTDAIEVSQVVGAKKANAKIAGGWKLLAVVPANYEDGSAEVIYVLGRSRPKDEAGGR